MSRAMLSYRSAISRNVCLSAGRIAVSAVARQRFAASKRYSGVRLVLCIPSERPLLKAGSSNDNPAPIGDIGLCRRLRTRMSRKLRVYPKSPPGPTYLYTVSCMLLCYLRNAGPCSRCVRANVDSKKHGSGGPKCPRQTDFCVCDPYWSVSVSADPRSTGKCRKGRFRVRCRSATIVAAGANRRSTVGWPIPQATGSPMTSLADGT